MWCRINVKVCSHFIILICIKYRFAPTVRITKFIYSTFFGHYSLIHTHGWVVGWMDEVEVHPDVARVLHHRWGLKTKNHHRKQLVFRISHGNAIFYFNCFQCVTFIVWELYAAIFCNKSITNQNDILNATDKDLYWAPASPSHSKHIANYTPQANGLDTYVAYK